jgi:hypothetical protein
MLNIANYLPSAKNAERIGEPVKLIEDEAD